MSNGRWVRAKHHAFLNQALVYLEARKAPAGFLRRLAASRAIAADVADDDEVAFTRLIVEMPPRHGKSELDSKYFPAWYLGRNPTHHFMEASYEADFARSWGRKTRDLLEVYGQEQFGVTVGKKTSAADDWELEGEGMGGMLTAGVGGAMTGRGANALHIDDPVKNAQEAASPTIQERNFDWWRSTAYTRLETAPDGREGIVLVTTTRWNAADLVGKILTDEELLDDTEVWFTLELAAIAGVNDPIGRKPGEALWPERYGIERLERIRHRLGSYYWSALYQQRPSAEEGNIFKRSWWNYYDEVPEGQHFGYVFVDTAGYDDKTTGDYAVLAAVVRRGKDLFWLDVQRGHWQFPELVQRCMDMHDQHQLPVCIEDVPWAKPLIQTLSNKVSGVVPFKIGGANKTARAQAGSPYAEAGNFFLPRKGKWTQDFIEEHAAFPTGAHDDQVDTTSMAVLRLLVGGAGQTAAAQIAALYGAGARRTAPTKHVGGLFGG